MDRKAVIESLRRRLAEEEENLLLIEEQRSKYVLETDVPLGLTKQERAKRKVIADLQVRLAELEAAPPEPDDVPPVPAGAGRVSVQAVGRASVSTASVSGREPQRKYLIRLRQILDTYFNAGDLRTLCFDLSVDYDSLPGEGKANKARELVAYLERRGRIPELVALGRQQRPNVSWESAPEETREAPPASQSPPPERFPGRDSLHAQLEMAEKVLAVYEEQAAGYTTLTIPAHLAVNLEEQREKVARLRAQLAALGG